MIIILPFSSTSFFLRNNILFPLYLLPPEHADSGVPDVGVAQVDDREELERREERDALVYDVRVREGDVRERDARVDDGAHRDRVDRVAREARAAALAQRDAPQRRGKSAERDARAHLRGGGEGKRKKVTLEETYVYTLLFPLPSFFFPFFPFIPRVRAD